MRRNKTSNSIIKATKINKKIKRMRTSIKRIDINQVTLNLTKILIRKEGKGKVKIKTKIQCFKKLMLMSHIKKYNWKETALL